MDSETKIIKLKSNKNNNFELEISNHNNEIIINIERKGKIIIEYFTLNLLISDFQELNNYFSKFLTLKELINELNKIINSSNELIEGNNDLILKITLPNSNKDKISLSIKKNRNKNLIYLKNAIKELNTNLENIELGTRDIKKEKQDIKKNFENINHKNISLKIQFNNLNSELNKFLEKLSEYQSTYYFKKDNFHWINKEVTVTKNSKFVIDFSPEILLGKEKQKSYYLSDGNKNHFIEFSFNKIYYLKKIRIIIGNNDCSLKSFTIDIIDEKGNEGNVGFFTMKQYEFNNGCQEFKIERGCKNILLNLINNWGNSHYIQICRIDFFVSE